MSKYEEIKETLKSQKAIQALDRVKEGIEHYKSENIQFNVASIGRYCEDKWGTPKTQSIRNSNSLMYYIKDELENNTYVKSSSKDLSNKKKFENFIVDQVEDENIKNYIKIQQEKLRLMEQKYNNLKKVMNQLNPIDVDKLIEDNMNFFDVEDLNEIKQIGDNVNCGTDNRNSDFDINEFVDVLNDKFLSKLDVKFKVIRNDKGIFVINENTNSIII